MSDDSQNLPADELIGQTLGQYTILEEAGRGGMATVYMAKQTSMNRNVAVKVLPPHFLHVGATRRVALTNSFEIDDLGII